jgi:nucleoside-diphosphate-sugar epimerase
MQSQEWRRAVLRQHEHNSDMDLMDQDDEEADLFYRDNANNERTRSFSDGEDASPARQLHPIQPRRLLDADTGYGSNDEDYSHRSNNNNRSNNDDSYWSPNRNGLHHRHPVHVDSDDDDDENRGNLRLPIRKRNGNNRNHPSYSAQQKKKKWTPWMCKALVGTFWCYVGLVIWIYSQHDILQSETTATTPLQQLPLQGVAKATENYFSIFASSSSSARGTLARAQQKQLASYEITAASRLKRQALVEQEFIHYQRAQAHTRQRALARRTRTRPPDTTATITTAAIPSYKILPVDQQERARYPIGADHDDGQVLQKMLPAAMEELCGFYAQNASLAYPQSYLARDALNANSRVLITGILNPIGFHLALALKERCGVQVMTGIDPMLPNTVQHRLTIVERIQILVTNIPELFRPILTPFIGLDPKVGSKETKTNAILDVTGELDLLSFRPTHIVHLASYHPTVYSNPQGKWKNLQSPYVSPDYNPLLFSIRSTMTSMEQILASIASTADPKERSHLTYASSNRLWQTSDKRDDIVHSHTRKIDEVLADTYHSLYGIYSVAMRLPNAVYGTWGHPASDIHKLLHSATHNETFVPGDSNSNNLKEETLDMVHVDDIVDAFISAMQFRYPSSKPAAFELTSGMTSSLEYVKNVAQALLSKASKENISAPQTSETVMVEASETSQTRQYLEWSPHTPIDAGLLGTMAWHLDRKHLYGPKPSDSQMTIETGDAFLARHHHETCAADDLVCHASRKYLPCASECSTRDKCIPSIFDGMIEMTQEVTEGCDVVLYTQAFGRDVEDLALQSEYMEEGNLLICNFAFVSSTSKLVESVIQKVPNAELANMGVIPRPEDLGKVGAIHERKVEKLNGRLLYRGWILLWTKDNPEPLPKTDEFLLKLSPGRLFSKDVMHAVFIDPGFAVSPTTDDITFLIHEMRRPAWEERTMKRKAKPKARFRLPPEPERVATLLMSRMKYQYASDMERLAEDAKISVYLATKCMRYENGEEPLGKEPPEIKLQREFYERVASVVNRDPLRSPLEPLYQYSMRHWSRSRWVVHDLTLEESRQLRCDWYQEHVQWDSDLDQLSFAHVMAKRELERRMEFGEPDDHSRKAFADKTEMKKLLTDAHEWYAMQTEPNRYYSAHDGLEVLPYDSVDEQKSKASLDGLAPANDKASLFVRLVSDRIMSYSRKAWNNAQPVDE